MYLCSFAPRIIELDTSPKPPASLIVLRGILWQNALPYSVTAERAYLISDL